MITLKKIFIKNFKAFHEEQVIPLEKITLIFGKNSAGKSTILHAIALLRQILQARGNIDMDQLQLANKQLNLGSLDKVRFDHDSNNHPTLSLECLVTRQFGSLKPENVLDSSSIFDEENYDHFDGRWRSMADDPNDVYLSLAKGDWYLPLPKFKVGDSLRVSWELHDGFHILKIDHNGVTIAIYKDLGLMESDGISNKEINIPLQTLFLANPLVKRTRELLYQFAMHNGNWDNIERYGDENRERNQFNKIFDDWFETDRKDSQLAPYQYLYSGQEPARINIDLELFPESDLPRELDEACREVYKAALDPERYSGIEYDRVRKEMIKLFEAVNTDHLGWMASNLSFKILTAIENGLGTDYIPAHRPPPPRDVTKSRITEWITQGASTRSWIKLFDDKVLCRFNAWLDYIGVGFTAVCRKLEIHDPDAPRNSIVYDPQIVFTKPGRNLRSSHADLGYGVGQLVPILVAGSSSESQGIKIVEQPEAQVHPGLQAQLGDFFIGQSSNWLIETHSEHLILRILRRIRETTESEIDDWPDALHKACPNGIRPDDVSVLYVQPGDNGSEVIELPVTPVGGFSRPWPGGFFEEQLKELG